MFALMLSHIDKLLCSSNPPKESLTDCLVLTSQGDHRSMSIRVGINVEDSSAPAVHGCSYPLDDPQVTALRKIGNSFYEQRNLKCARPPPRS
jgi:hypothetical protein